MFPVDFTLDRHMVVFRTDEGTKLNVLLDRVAGAAEDHAGHLALIGILPTPRRADLGPGVMTDVPRYRALRITFSCWADAALQAQQGPVTGTAQRSAAKRMFMREMAYSIRGFLTVRNDSLRVPVNGSLTVHADPDSGLFTGDLVLQQSTIRRTVLGISLFSVAVQIAADSPVIGRIDRESQMFATVTVDAVIAAVRAAGRALIGGGECRTTTHAVVPLRSTPGFNLGRGGRLVGRYHRPPFTGCGWVTPLVNLLAAGPGNAVVIDLIPLPS